MEIGNWTATESLNEIYREIRELGLETNIAEIDAYGFTVIEDALSRELTVSLRDAVVSAAEDFHKLELDLDREESLRELQAVTFLLFKDQLFEEAVLHRKSLALMSYCLGKGCLLTSLVSHVKGPGGTGLPLHADSSQAGMPSPLAGYSHMANINFCLTDYTEEKGALAIVPGSHRHCRQPTQWESAVAGNSRNPDAIAIEAPAGTAVFFIGATWHGSFPRQIPGLRLNLSAVFVRPYMSQLEAYRDRAPADFLERHGPDSRMRQLLGYNTGDGWHEEGPNSELLAKQGSFGRSWQG
jgi:ectoine hydroxylase-related dioxygenase (phytanoyl-CoA dioxygenase family)